MLSALQRFPKAPLIEKPTTALLDAVHRALEADDTRRDRVRNRYQPAVCHYVMASFAGFFRRTLSSIFSTQSSGII
jgi:hypothetical protein